MAESIRHRWAEWLLHHRHGGGSGELRRTIDHLGKVRDRVRAPSGAPRDELEQLCLQTRGVKAHLDGHEIAKVIVVPDKLVNIVVR